MEEIPREKCSPINFLELMFFIGLYHASLKNYDSSKALDIDMPTWYYLLEQLSEKKIPFCFLDGTEEYPNLEINETEIIIDNIPEFLEHNSIFFSPSQETYDYLMSFMKTFFN